MKKIKDAIETLEHELLRELLAAARGGKLKYVGRDPYTTALVRARMHLHATLLAVQCAESAHNAQTVH
jgi:hypothetical protein